MNFSKTANKMTRTKTLTGKPQGMQFQTSIVGGSYAGEEFQQNNNCPLNGENFKTVAFEMPLFEKKEFHILPLDNYLSESLKFSTFAIDDMILIYLN